VVDETSARETPASAAQESLWEEAPEDQLAEADHAEEGEQAEVVPSEDSVVEAEEGVAGAGGDGDEEAAATGKPGGAPLLNELRDVERHFLQHHFDEVFQTCNRAWVEGNIAGNHLSPGLLTLLRHAVAEERRYPGKLTPMLCRQLSGRHVAVFKWRRKLKAGPSRPHPVPEDIAIADRPMSLLNWISENSGKKLEHLWKAVLPAEISDKDKLGWYHDLHWLLNQGYVLLMADSTIHRAKRPGEDDQGAAPGKAKQAKRREQRSKPKDSAPPKKGQQLPPEKVLAPSSVSASQGAPGLYALTGRTLSGVPKSPESLRGRGLWPLLSRLEESLDEGADEDDGEEESFQHS